MTRATRSRFTEVQRPLRPLAILERHGYVMPLPAKPISGRTTPVNAMKSSPEPLHATAPPRQSKFRCDHAVVRQSDE